MENRGVPWCRGVHMGNGQQVVQPPFMQDRWGPPSFGLPLQEGQANLQYLSIQTDATSPSAGLPHQVNPRSQMYYSMPNLTIDSPNSTVDQPWPPHQNPLVQVEHKPQSVSHQIVAAQSNCHPNSPAQACSQSGHRHDCEYFQRLHTRVNNMRTYIKNCLAQIEILQVEKQKAKDTIGTLQREKREAGEAIVTLKLDVHKLTEREKQLQTDNKGLRTQLAQEQSEKSTLQGSLTKVQDELNGARKILQERSHEFYRDLAKKLPPQQRTSQQETLDKASGRTKKPWENPVFSGLNERKHQSVSQSNCSSPVAAKSSGLRSSTEKEVRKLQSIPHSNRSNPVAVAKGSSFTSTSESATRKRGRPKKEPSERTPAKKQKTRGKESTSLYKDEYEFEDKDAIAAQIEAQMNQIDDEDETTISAQLQGQSNEVVSDVKSKPTTRSKTTTGLQIFNTGDSTEPVSSSPAQEPQSTSNPTFDEEDDDLFTDDVWVAEMQETEEKKQTE